MRTQKERSRSTRRRIIHVSLNIIRLKGFRSLTFAAVARKAKITTGAIQHHFKNKEDLLLAVVPMIFSTESLDRKSLPSVSLPLRQRVESLIDTYWNSVQGTPEFRALFTLYHAAQGYPSLLAKLNDQRLGIVARNYDIWNEVFPEYANSAEVRRAKDAALTYLRGLGLYCLFPVSNDEIAYHKAIVCDITMSIMSPLARLDVRHPRPSWLPRTASS